jgi:hypothetical protein
MELGVPDATCTVAGTLHVGAKAGEGLTLQVRLRVPVKLPLGVADNVKLAFCPATTVEDADEEGAREKPEDCEACKVKTCDAVCEKLPEAPVTVTV